MEAIMKKTFYLTAAAALLMASTAAHAGNGFSFQIDGQNIHVEAPRNCNSLSCISVTNNGSAVNLKNLKGKKSNDEDDVASNAPPPAPAPAAPPAPAAQAPAAPPAPVPTVVYASPAPSAPAPAAVYAPPAPPAPVANAAPPAPDASRERISGLPASTTARTAPAAPPAPVASIAPVAPAAVAYNAPPAQQPVAESAPPAAASTTPLGLWQTADNKGNVRIEQCGANLCGFAEHTDERILINMKPSSDNNKWTGRIHDPDSGSNYDSTIAMKGPNLLKVQGCAFGGLFCGGQTWKRIS
jgi:uncharacterized protein (DUF2147 family)